MSSRHRNLESLGRWHATIILYTVSICSPKRDKHRGHLAYLGRVTSSYGNRINTASLKWGINMAEIRQVASDVYPS